jgi:hypothetical protein
MTSPKILYTKSADNEHKFLQVTHTAYFDTHVGRYGILKSGYSAELIPDKMDRCVNFSGLRPRKRESCRGLIMDLPSSLLSFSTPTQSHDSGNHSNDYVHSKTILVRSSVDHRKSDSSTASKLGFNFGIDENYDFLRLSYCLIN